MKAVMQTRSCLGRLFNAVELGVKARDATSEQTSIRRRGFAAIARGEDPVVCSASLVPRSMNNRSPVLDGKKKPRNIQISLSLRRSALKLLGPGMLHEDDSGNPTGIKVSWTDAVACSHAHRPCLAVD
uniref:Uncharacterized protein n=1 Tax=Coccidioides posadasii RMSCC 3488 TaxID=454284 RepID=A0A0J6FH72_COCPO|nr:hypothetical protein CPAG_04580 [Coccidioides posadasii RMSCC 3488]